MSGTNMSTSMEQALFNMVEQQVRPWYVVDEDVLRTLRSVPREDFVQPEYRRLAFSDVRIPVGHDQVMMKPVEEGRMLQALAIQPGDRKSTRLNSSHVAISYAVFCLKKK